MLAETRSDFRIDAVRRGQSRDRKASLRGFFITFEGGEGAGKSTQIRLLQQHLQESGQAVLVTREPGGSPGAEAVRHVILSGAAEPFGPAMEVVLFAAARLDHVQQVIRPALEQGAVVLCDRFYDSTRAYQGTSRGVNKTLLSALERAAVGDTVPDLTIILDIDAKVGLQRASDRRGEGGADRFEKEALAIHQRRRDAFLAIAKAEPDRCVIINAERSVDAVAVSVRKAVDAAMKKKASERKPASTRKSAHV